MYTIEITEGQWVVLTQGRATTTHSFQYASVFKSKERADKIAKKVDGKVVSYYGSNVVQGSKKFVAPKQSPINKNSPYRSI